MNPIKILVLFISMTILSIFLDETGFFRYLAAATLKKAGGSQKKLFILLYLIVSVLTVFTSNDIIVLTFTPFICYFAKEAKIKSLPYLITVFVAANTWSMALIIGNPTNIFLASSSDIDFFFYVKRMCIPTFFAGLTSFLILYLLFRLDFYTPVMAGSASSGEPGTTLSGQKTGYISDMILLVIGLLHLAFATLMLALSSYIGFEMWSVALGSVISLFLCNFIYSMIKRRKPKEILVCLKRAPWTLVPFLLSMFGLILLLKHFGFSAFLNSLLEKAGGKRFPVFTYGISSFLSCNIINNIPMSVLFSSVAENIDASNKMICLFAIIIGSNIGAFLTPIGALAGIMWRKILKNQGIEFSVLDFVKYGSVIAFPSIFTALFVLNLGK